MAQLRESITREQFKTAHAALKARIKASAATGRAHRHEARALLGRENGEATGASRHQKHLAARQEGKTARSLLLAYGWLKGRPALALESLSTRLGVADALFGATVHLSAALHGTTGPNGEQQVAIHQELLNWYAARLEPVAAAAVESDALPRGEEGSAGGAEGSPGDACSPVAAE